MKLRLTLALLLLVVSRALAGSGFEHFVTVSGARLMDGDQPLRFLSFNVPTLNYQEDELAFATTTPYALPTEFEMRDVFATVREMGGQVIRIYTIPVRNRHFPADAPTYVEAPGEFNEAAFRITDRMLALAHEYHVRIIFSLLNNHEWMGGRPNYAAFRGKSADAFWTDPQLIADFKQTIAHTLNRTNTITGVRYADDPAILCWETGNELACPEAWTAEIARYLKSLDRHHLVMDGFFAIDDVPVRASSVADPNIDLISSHHYERDPADMLAHIARNRAIVAGRKPYLIGEFGFVGTPALQQVMARILASPDICGGLIWSLRHHREHGGFYWHSEPLGLGRFKAYHFPGFASGRAYDEENVIALLRRNAFALQGRSPPPLAVPAAPELLPIDEVFAISWKGSAGAAGYHVERATSTEGPWAVVGYNVSDAEVPYFPLFHDRSAREGERYFYRVIAANGSGASAPSNVVGPVTVRRLAIVDTMQNLTAAYDVRDVTVATGADRSYKELLHRLAGDRGATITYAAPGLLDEFRVYAFEGGRAANLLLQGSVDGRSWQDLKVEPTAYVNAETNYAYQRPKLYVVRSPGLPAFLRIVFKGQVQLGRVELLYHGTP